MSDFFDTMLNGIPEGNMKVLTKNKVITNPILAEGMGCSHDSDTITILVDYLIKGMKLKQFQNLIERSTSNYQIIYPITIDPTNYKGSLKDLYIDYSIQFEKYVSEWSNIICLGRTLFSICKCDDLDASVMSNDDGEGKGDIDRNSICSFAYDTLLWKTSFFDPLTKSKIFPVDSILDLFSSKGSIPKIAQNFEVWFFERQLGFAKTKNKHLKLKKLEKVRVDNVNAWLQEHKDDKSMIALDTETNTLDPFSSIAKLKCITIAYDSSKGYYLPFDSSVDINLLSEYLKDRPIIGTNLKYDIKFFLNLGIPIENFHIVGDTIILQGLCNELCRKGLKAGAFMWTTWGGYDKALDDWKKKNKCNDYSKIDDNILMDYAVTDAITSFAVHESQLKYLNRLDTKYNSNNKYGYSLKYCYNEIMIPMYNIVCETEYIGMSFDKDKLDKVSSKMIEAIKESEYNIKKQLGKENDSSFNINGEDLGIELEKMGLPITDRKENGNPSVGVDQLHTWSNKGYKIADDISHYRELSKNFTCFIGVEHQENLSFSLYDEDDIFDGGTYVKTKKKAKKKGPSGLYKYSHDDGKIHGNFSMYSCQSLRNRSSNMNLQQIPAHGDKAKIARSCFTPLTKHHAFMSTDYSAIQTRLATVESEDKKLTEVYTSKDENGDSDGDLHLLTAYSYIPYILRDLDTYKKAQKCYKMGNEYPNFDVLKGLRQKAKAINFGAIFSLKSSGCLIKSVLDWEDSVIEDYIKATNLTREWTTLYHENKVGFDLPDEDRKRLCKATVISKDLHTKFFTNYSGLAEWEQKKIDFAMANGYSQSYFGTLRRTPYLLVSKNYNDDVNGKKYSQFSNVSINSIIQTEEVMTISRAFVNIYNRSKKEGLWIHKEKDGWFGSYLMGTIHDAGEFVVELRNQEYLKFNKIVHEEFGKKYNENHTICFDCESNIAPYYHTGEYWDMGSEINPEDLYTLSNIDKITGLPLEEKGQEEVMIK